MDATLSELRDRHGILVGDGVALVGVDALVRRPFDPGMALVVLPAEAHETSPEANDAPAANHETPAANAKTDPFEPDALPGRHGHGTAALDLLRRLYPADHPVLGLTGDAGTSRATISTVTAADLEGSAHLVPPLAHGWNAASPYGLPWLVARLRAPGGCHWDREQNHLTLRPYLLEEAYEVYDALEAGSTPALAEELGDLLLQIVLHAQYGAEAGVFDLADVQRSIFGKIVRRHPHVFGDVTADTSDEVIRNWERIKADERATETSAGAADPAMPAAFAGLSKSLPALAYASEMQGRAAGLGYDWPDLEGVIDKIAEEASELLAATDQAERAEEFGDLLFVMVNLGRKLAIDPEAALRAASRKFASRFARVERFAAARGVELRALGLDALDELWQEAKVEERNELADGSRAAGILATMKSSGAR
jgi:tetrapyrrole methylase family protein/MazG family protein